MSFECGYRLMRSCVPQLHGIIQTGRGQCLTVRRKGYCIDALFMSAERGYLLMRSRIPQLHSLVLTAGRNQPAVRGKDYVSDRLGMSGERDGVFMVEPPEVVPLESGHFARFGVG